MEKQAQTRADQGSGLDIGRATKPAEKALNSQTKGIDEGGKGSSENQDIPIPLQLIGFEVTLHIFQLLIRIIYYLIYEVVENAK